MSKSSKLYLGATLGLIGIPLILSFWSLATALMAILMLGSGAYAMAACFLLVSFWHRAQYGTWPIELEEDPSLDRSHLTAMEPMDVGISLDREGPCEGSESEKPYRLSEALQALLRRLSSSA